jgi:signal transduction histidine kinase/ABC-type uncharacterized transport system substrate-binding protein
MGFVVQEWHRWVLVVLGALTQITALAPGALAADAPPAADPPVRNILMLHVTPRSSAALIAVEGAFTNALRAATSEPLSFGSEYIDLAMFDQKETFEPELVAYLAAKYARVKLDLVMVTGSTSLRFMTKHRTRLFPGVPIVFVAVIRRALGDLVLDADISGVWLPIAWKDTLDAARRLEPGIERAVVVAGAAPADTVWVAEARAQLARTDPPIDVTYLEGRSIEAILERVAALPPRSVVLLGPVLRDTSGRRFAVAETTARISAASKVPVYGLGDTQLGHGVVGGRVVEFELQGQRAGELAGRVLRGERPPPIEGDTLAYRFDARQLRRFSLDARRLPPGSRIEFDEPSLWQVYRSHVLAGLVLLVLETWMIATLLINRAERRRAEETLAAQLRFETMVSDLLAGQMTLPGGAADARVEQSLARIGEVLGVDRMILVELAPDGSIGLADAWQIGDVPEPPASILWSSFPWIGSRLAAGHAVVVSPRHPLPAEADADRKAMALYGTRSLLAVPMRVEGVVAGALGCATVRRAREWPDELIDRLRLVADVFAGLLARRRAEAAARESEAHSLQLRQDFAHALRVNTLSELGASLAHEINQPLSAILANAHALRTTLRRRPGDEAVTLETVADIAADARRAGDIISRLRALSRKEHLHQRGLDVDALIGEVIGLLHQDFVRRGIAVHRTCEPGVPRISGDRVQLQQIFLNVLVNASEALDGADVDRREIAVTTHRESPGLVEVAIRDNGAADVDLDTERMFERFMTSKPGGLGMGLAISRSIVTAHGGSIYAKPNPDRGLTVYVQLPADA